MTTTAFNIKVRNRWNALKYLDYDTKLDIITLLTQSLKLSKKRKQISAKKFYGIWKDDMMSAEELVEILKSERQFNQDIVEL